MITVAAVLLVEGCSHKAKEMACCLLAHPHVFLLSLFVDRLCVNLLINRVFLLLQIRLRASSG